MQKLGKSLIRLLRHDESGAAMIEYSILIGLISAAVIAIIVFVGSWVVGAWTHLSTSLGSIP
jgi:pilus assembly protein Flp/PilA